MSTQLNQTVSATSTTTKIHTALTAIAIAALMLFVTSVLYSASAHANASADVNVIYLQGDAATARLAELTKVIDSGNATAKDYKDAGIIIHQINRTDMQIANVKKGEKYLKKAAKLDPKDHETKAWLGSTITMKAPFVDDPGKKTLYVKMGSRKMDTAIRKQPDNLRIRLIRGFNSIEIPAFLKRTRFAVEDFNHYLTLCEKGQCHPQEVEKVKTGLQFAQTVLAAK